MFLWLILGTLVNYTVLSVFTRFFSEVFLKRFIIVNFLISILLTVVCFFEIGYWNEISYLYLFNWINIGIMDISFVLLFDTLTIVMVFIVLFISCLVHIYSFSYMAVDPHFFRFIAYLSLFTFFMLVLVTSSNFLQLLIGWEGVGLSSYLLICFWYTRVAANLAAIKAMSVNRIGDIFLLFTIFLIFSFFGNLNFGLVFNNVIYLLDFYFDLFFFEIRFLDLLCFFIFLSACGKSAQLLLHIWLPDAMEGPTPVSALIHAATMVTAGVFLVIRCSILFEYSSKILFFMVFIGSLTCFLMSIFGAFQQDIKKIVAFSTCSQLGYMFMGCGLSSYNTSFFHLFNHAFFKALLFLSMGIIIHALSDEQDLRKMGNLINFLPYTIVLVFFGNVALLGLPFLAGFFSKDILIEVAYARLYFDGSFSYLLGLFAAFFTAFYSTRLFFRIFYGFSNFNRFTVFKIHEVDILMFIPTILLLLCSFFVGFFFFDMFLGMGSFFFFDSIFIHFLHYSGIFIEFESLLNSFFFSDSYFILDELSLRFIFFRDFHIYCSSPFYDYETKVILFEPLSTFLHKRRYLGWDGLFCYSNGFPMVTGFWYNYEFISDDLHKNYIRPLLFFSGDDSDIYINGMVNFEFYVKHFNYFYVGPFDSFILDTDSILSSTKGNSSLFYDRLNEAVYVDLNTKILYESIVVERLFYSYKIINNYFLFINNFVLSSIDLNSDLEFKFFIKILPLIVSFLGFCFYYFFDNRFIVFYHNFIYRKIFKKIYNGLFFDKLFIENLVYKFFFFSYFSFYKNIESSFLQKYNILIFEQNIFKGYSFFKIFSKGYFFIYILIVLFFIYFYFLFYFVLNFLNFILLPLIFFLFNFCFILKNKNFRFYINKLLK